MGPCDVAPVYAVGLRYAKYLPFSLTNATSHRRLVRHRLAAGVDGNNAASPANRKVPLPLLDPTD